MTFSPNETERFTMNIKTIVTAATLAFATFAAHAASPWFQTATVNDEGTIQKEYIIPHSVRKLGGPMLGRVYTMFARDTFDPPVSGVQASLTDIVIDCDNWTWGTYHDVAFTKDGEPRWIMEEKLDKSGPVWLPEMKRVTGGASYETMKYVCNAG